MVKRFTVKSSIHSVFPVDMLRYDRCWPVDGESAAAIHNSISHDAFDRGVEEIEGLKERTIRMCTLEDEPTVKRWQSFGWTVTE